MTSAATVFGHFPLVLVSGPGAEARNSIGIVLVTGMIVGTLFTLFVVPVFYTLIAADHRKPDAQQEAKHPRSKDTPMASRCRTELGRAAARPVRIS